MGYLQLVGGEYFPLTYVVEFSQIISYIFKVHETI